MTTFTEDFQRRLRAVLAKHTGREIPDSVTVEIVADGSSYGDDDSRGMDHEIRIRAMGSGVFAEHIYDEPGAGARLMADLDTVDEPRPLTPAEAALLVKLNDQGGQPYDENDNYAPSVLAERGLVDLHGRHWYITPAGRGAATAIRAAVPPASPPFVFTHVEMIAEAAPAQWWAWDELGARYYLRFRFGKGTVTAVLGDEPTLEDPVVREFVHGDNLTSHISLDEFAQLARIDVSQIPEEQRR